MPGISLVGAIVGRSVGPIKICVVEGAGVNPACPDAGLVAVQAASRTIRGKTERIRFIVSPVIILMEKGRPAKGKVPAPTALSGASHKFVMETGIIIQRISSNLGEAG